MFERYANFYDLLYRKKDYEAECDFLEDILRKQSAGQARRILDLGCGTGGHALPLAKRGYQVIGVDQSEGMLATARTKAAALKDAGASGSAAFHLSDIRDLSLQEEPFDAVIAMFAVFSYLKTNEDVDAAFRSARRYLKPGGLFIFDAWFGPAVLAQRPTDRRRIIEQDGERILRFAEATLDILNHGVQVDYSLLRVKDGRVLEEINETHWQRFFFPLEVKHYLDGHGFSLLNLCPFMELDREPAEQDWYFTAVSRAI